MVCDLSGLGEEPARLLGALLASSFAQAAEARSDVAEAAPRYTIYIDEFQNFASLAFAKILSEARKWHLSIVLCHQFIGQISERGLHEAGWAIAAPSYRSASARKTRLALRERSTHRSPSWPRSRAVARTSARFATANRLSRDRWRSQWRCFAPGGSRPRSRTPRRTSLARESSPNVDRHHRGTIGIDIRSRRIVSTEEAAPLKAAS